MSKEKELVVFVGVPGSGKTTFYKNNYSDYHYISPDALRREICGSINDQSKNREIWEKAYDMLKNACSKDVNKICFDATNVRQKYLTNILDITDSYGFDNVKFLFFMDSLDYDLCRHRIENDIKNKVDRSNVPEDVSIKMSDNFINLVSKIEDLVKDWKHKYTNINIEIEYIN